MIPRVREQQQEKLVKSYVEKGLMREENIPNAMSIWREEQGKNLRFLRHALIERICKNDPIPINAELKNAMTTAVQAHFKSKGWWK